MADKRYTKGEWDDEVLADDPLYDVLLADDTPVHADVKIQLKTAVVTPGTPVAKDPMDNIEEGIDLLDTIVADRVAGSITTGGTSTAFTLTTHEAGALVTGERFPVKFHTTAGATPTLERDGKGPKLLKYYDSTGAKVACGASTIISGMITRVEYDGTDWIVMDLLPATASDVDAGTDSGKPIAAAALVASKRNVRHILIQLLDKDTPCAAGTSIGGDKRLQITGTIIDVGYYHDVAAGSTGTEIIDIHLGGTTIMTTDKMAGAAGEKSSEDGGATQPTLTTTAYTANGILTFDIDTAHTGTVPNGLTVWLKIRES